MRHSVSPRKGPLQPQQRSCRSCHPRPLLQPSLPLLRPQCLYYHCLPGLPHRSRCKLSLVQQMVHAAKARSDLTAEELADLVSVCPVTWQNDDQGNPVGTWTTLPYSVVREVKKAICEFGLTSTFVRGLIEGMGTGYSLIPEDWKTLLRMMLSPSQYVIWLSEYRQMAERQAQVYREQGIIYEHLAGEGQFATTEMQSQLPQAVFPIISTCAQHAFKKVPDSGKPTKSFEAILQQVDNTEAAHELLLKLAVENANEDCRRALQAAQASGILELSDMLRACQNIGTQAHKAGVLAAALRKTGKEGKRCYRCGLVDTGADVTVIRDLEWPHLLATRHFPYFVAHIRSHTPLPGPLTEGNAHADRTLRGQDRCGRRSAAPGDTIRSPLGRCSHQPVP
ncbi:unnamed protein product [Lepidochelys olivacea]